MKGCTCPKTLSEPGRTNLKQGINPVSSSVTAIWQVRFARIIRVVRFLRQLRALA